MNETQNVEMLLQSAARLVERAVGMLNVAHRQCERCGVRIADDMTDYRIHERIWKVPARLRAAADLKQTGWVAAIKPSVEARDGEDD